MSASNIIHAIYYNAHISNERGDRGQEGDVLYGQITDSEYADLENLCKNKDMANEYLFKGIKNEYPVGQVQETVDDDNDKFNPGSGDPLMRKPTKDLTTIMASQESRNLQEGTNDALKSGSIMTKIPETVEIQDPVDPKKSKSKARKESPGKKGGKKKKVSKKAKMYVESNDIPEGMTKGLNLYRPDRGTMQKLVKRAADLKDLKKDKDKLDLSQFRDVAPWFKSRKINEDLDLEMGPEEDAQEKKESKQNRQFNLILKLLRDIHAQKEAFRKKQGSSVSMK